VVKRRISLFQAWEPRWGFSGRGMGFYAGSEYCVVSVCSNCVVFCVWCMFLSFRDTLYVLRLYVGW
jgi:hypothetical protein